MSVCIWLMSLNISLLLFILLQMTGHHSYLALNSTCLYVYNTLLYPSSAVWDCIFSYYVSSCSRPVHQRCHWCADFICLKYVLWYGIAQPTVSDAICGKMVLGHITKKQTEQIIESKPISSILPWYLLWFLPPGLSLQFFS